MLKMKTSTYESGTSTVESKRGGVRVKLARKETVILVLICSLILTSWFASFLKASTVVATLTVNDHLVAQNYLDGDLQKVVSVGPDGSVETEEEVHGAGSVQVSAMLSSGFQTWFSPSQGALLVPADLYSVVKLSGAFPVLLLSTLLGFSVLLVVAKKKWGIKPWQLWRVKGPLRWLLPAILVLTVLVTLQWTLPLW